MPGRMKTSPVSAAACVALAVMAAACNPDSATTGPSGLQPKDFAANLRLVSGDQQLAPIGSALALPIVVKVVDAGGQPVQGASVAFSVRAGGGSINPAANVSDGNGIVASTWTLGTSLGANKAVAILTNNFVLDSTTFTATATTGPVAVFTIVSGNNQTATVGQALAAPLVVKAADSFGNPLSGAKVTWTPNASNGSVTFTTDTTAADGTATATWTLGTGVGAQGVVASVLGAAPLTFAATATAGLDRLMTITGGTPQTGSVSTLLPVNLSVSVTDQFSNPVTGAVITWTIVTGGGSVSVGSSTTVAGVASTAWTLGGTAGAQTVRADLAGTNSQTFAATATVAFSDVFAGNFMACGIVANNNSVYCWGAGSDGQLGQGSTENVRSPSKAVAFGGAPIQARLLSGGRNGFCALSIARTLSCWGKTALSAPSTSPTSVALTINAGTAFPNNVGIGEDFGCIINLAGDAGCSGVNVHGQLGDGLAPAGAAGGTFNPLAGAGIWSSVVVGRTHGCAMPRNAGTVASQTPRCWGLNNEGQAGTGNGIGTFTDVTAPTAITMPTGTMRFDSTMAAGATHTCAIEGATSDVPGRAWCWGNNGYGQLGSSAAVLGAGRYDTPRSVDFPAGVTAWSRIYAGEFHTCAIEAAGSAAPGKAWCWGRNDYGQLGIGATSAPTATATSAVNIGLTFRSLSLGELYTCGVVGPPTIPASPSQPLGTVYCWGDNLFGQIGNGAPASSIPVLAVTRVANQP